MRLDRVDSRRKEEKRIALQAFLIVLSIYFTDSAVVISGNRGIDQEG